jgi:uncharacterized protein YcsI (UPF0317 family)
MNGVLIMAVVLISLLAITGTMVVMMRNIRASHVRRDLQQPSVTSAEVGAAKEVHTTATRQASWLNEQLELVREGKGHGKK